MKINFLSNETELYNSLLKYCKDIERVAIFNFSCEGSYEEINQYKWLQHEYPKLKSLQLDGWSFQNRDSMSKIRFGRLLIEFFHKNPFIEDIQTSNRFIRDLAIENLKNIKRLSITTLEIDPLNNNLLMCEKFKTIYQNNSCIGMIELEFFIVSRSDFLPFRDRVEMLNSIKPIHRIKLRFCIHVQPERLMFLMFLSEFKHLKCLQFIFYDNLPFPNHEVWENFSKKCLYLEELRIVVCDKYLGPQVSKELIKQFVWNSPKLKMLNLNNFETLDENDLSAWNELRKKLNGGVDITILDSCYRRRRPRMRPMSHGMVAFKRVYGIQNDNNFESAWK